MSLTNDFAGAICCIIGFALIFNARKLSRFMKSEKAAGLAVIFWRSCGLLWALVGFQFILGVLRLPARH